MATSKREVIDDIVEVVVVVIVVVVVVVVVVVGLVQGFQGFGLKLTGELIDRVNSNGFFAKSAKNSTAVVEQVPCEGDFHPHFSVVGLNLSGNFCLVGVFLASIVYTGREFSTMNYLSLFFIMDLIPVQKLKSGSTPWSGEHF